MAQTCGTDYVIKEDELLGDIAARVYGSTSQWTILFYANQDRIGANGSLLVPGLKIRVPCVGFQNIPAAPAPAMALAVAPAASPLTSPGASPDAGDFEYSSLVKRIEFLTADGSSPFTDRSLPGGGMITQIVSASMDQIKEKSNGNFEYSVSWINDWSAHLNPLLITRAFDVGFPWPNPDCDRPSELSQDGKYRCQKFFFSEPLYEAFTVLFVKKNSSLTFAKDDEIPGKTLCQPAGYPTNALDKSGRNWVKENKITLLRPQTVEECFRLLDNGSVNAVVASDLTGKAAVAALGLGNRVKALQRPVAIGTMHLIVAKTHPRASTILYYVNTGVTRLKESGEYDKIVETHLARFWKTQEGK